MRLRPCIIPGRGQCRVRNRKRIALSREFLFNLNMKDKTGKDEKK